MLVRVRIHLKGIAVEESSPVQRDSAQHAVIQGSLHHVGVNAIALKLQHPVRPKHQSDSRAGLRIGDVVRQIIVIGETLAMRQRANAPSDVHAPFGYVLPQTPTRGQQCLVHGFGGHVGHPAKEIHSPYGVPLSRGLLPHGQMRLCIVVPALAVGPRILAPLTRLNVKVVGLLTPLIDKELGQSKVPRLTCDPEQLDQGQLDLLVASVTPLLALAWPKDRLDVVGVPAEHIQ